MRITAFAAWKQFYLGGAYRIAPVCIANAFLELTDTLTRSFKLVS